MNWLTKIKVFGDKIKRNLQKKFPTKEEIANSDWTSCCKGPVLKKDLEENLWVCNSCGKHHRISCKQRFDIFFGKDRYEVLETPQPTEDPLNWKDTKTYKERLVQARKKTGQNCAVMIAKGQINGIQIPGFVTGDNVTKKLILGNVAEYLSVPVIEPTSEIILSENKVAISKGEFVVGSGFSVDTSSEVVKIIGTAGKTALKVITGNAAVGGALSVTGTTTLNGNVTLGDTASDSIILNGKLGQQLLSMVFSLQQETQL